MPIELKHEEVQQEVADLKKRTDKVELKLEKVSDSISKINTSIAVSDLDRMHRDEKFNIIDTKMAALSKDIKLIGDGIRSGFNRVFWLIGVLVITALWKFVASGGLDGVL